MPYHKYTYIQTMFVLAALVLYTNTHKHLIHMHWHNKLLFFGIFSVEFSEVHLYIVLPRLQCGTHFLCRQYFLPERLPRLRHLHLSFLPLTPGSNYPTEESCYTLHVFPFGWFCLGHPHPGMTPAYVIYHPTALRIQCLHFLWKV